MSYSGYVIRRYTCAIAFVMIAMVACDSAGYKKLEYKHPVDRSLSIENKRWVAQFKEQYKDSTAENTEKALTDAISELTDKNDNIHLLTECYNMLGTYYRNISSYNKAITTYKKGLNTADNIQKIELLNNIAVCYRRLDKFRTAASLHLEALKIIEGYKGDYKDISFQHRVSLNSIGNVYLSLKQYEDALRYFNESLKLETEARNHLGMAINYNNRGATYQYLGNYKKANQDYLRALNENSLINSKLGKSISYNSIGELYFIQGDYKNAMTAFDSARVYSSQLSDSYHKSITHLNLSKSYIQNGSFQKAWNEIKELERLANITNSTSIYQSLYEQMSEYYKKQNKYKEALEYYRKSITYNDSIINQANSNYINDIMSLYDTEKKEQQIKLLSARNQISSQRQKIAVAVIIILILTLTLFFYFERGRKERQILEMEILEQQLLRSQMNPHFLFNALGSIQSYILLNDVKKATGFLNNFASLTRSILEHSSERSIILSDEIEMLHNYIKLEKMRMQDSFDYNIHTDEKLETDFISIPPMLIQPFVENAIKHGLRNITYKGQLDIYLYEEDNNLNITVKDNGIGVNKAKQISTAHNSMSMKIFEKRRKLLWKTEKKRVEFSVEDCSDKNPRDKGTLVKIKFPIN